MERIKVSTFEDCTNSIIEGMKCVLEEMEEKGLLKDSTTFEEMSNYAGRHILISEVKEQK